MEFLANIYNVILLCCFEPFARYSFHKATSVGERLRIKDSSEEDPNHSARSFTIWPMILKMQVSVLDCDVIWSLC